MIKQIIRKGILFAFYAWTLGCYNETEGELATALAAVRKVRLTL